jgi:hypothetical protein
MPSVGRIAVALPLAYQEYSAHFEEGPDIVVANKSALENGKLALEYLINALGSWEQRRLFDA